MSTRSLFWLAAFVVGGSVLALVLPFSFDGTAFDLRAPRLAFTLLLGAVLAASGAAYQRVLQNPIADPYILGVASAASLALALFGELAPAAGSSAEIGVALVAAAAATAALLTWERNSGGGVEKLVLFGLGLNFVLSSALFLWLSLRHAQVGGGSLRWLFGRLPWARWSDVSTFALVAVPVLLLLVQRARALDALALGDSVARTLAVDPKRTRTLVIVACALAVGAATRSAGAIGFVGLVAPHVVQRCFSPSDGRAWLVASALVGAGFLALSDAVSRALLPPIEFPIGVVTTLVGGPLFLWLLGRRT